MCGGGWPKLPWGLDAFVLALPYLLFYEAIGWWVIPAYIGAVIGVRLGHGRGFHYRLPFKEGSDPEKVEWLIDSTQDVYTRKFLIMYLTGLAVTFALGLILTLHGHILAGFVIYVSGMLKSVAYMLPETWHSELARGFFLGLGVALAYMVI